MNKILEIYKERRNESLEREIDYCESKRDFILKGIDSSIRQVDTSKAVIFLKSIIYQEYLDKISVLNSKLSNLRYKTTKLTSFPFRI